MNARASFERALQIQSDYLPAIGNLAQLDRLDQKPDMARKRYETVLEKEPKNEQALLGYAGLVQSLGGESSEIESLLKKAVSVNAQSISARVALVAFYMQKGDLKQAQFSEEQVKQFERYRTTAPQAKSAASASGLRAASVDYLDKR